MHHLKAGRVKELFLESKILSLYGINNICLVYKAHLFMCLSGTHQNGQNNVLKVISQLHRICAEQHEVTLNQLQKEASGNIIHF